jgi:hypothetical protein
MGLQDRARTVYRTTSELAVVRNGRWTPTQVGVSVVGSGETAGDAARDYCAKLAEMTAD